MTFHPVTATAPPHSPCFFLAPLQSLLNAVVRAALFYVWAPCILLQAPWPPSCFSNMLAPLGLCTDLTVPSDRNNLPSNISIPPTLTSLLSLHANVISSTRPILTQHAPASPALPIQLACSNFPFVLSM